MTKGGTFLEKLKVGFGKFILGSIILNILFLLFGIVIFMNVNVTAQMVGVITGIYFIIFGLFAIIEFLSKKEVPIFKYKIFGGILTILLGFFIMFNPFKIITFALGIYLIIISICKLLESFNLKKYGYDGWLIMLVTSFLLLIFGVFIAVNPLEASMDIIQVMAIFIILSSILEICNLIMIYSKTKDIVKLFKNEK